MAGSELKNLSSAHRQKEVLRDINLSIADGEFIVSVGPTGYTKPRLLRMIADFEEITGGELEIGDAHTKELSPNSATSR